MKKCLKHGVLYLFLVVFLLSFISAETNDIKYYKKSVKVGKANVSANIVEVNLNNSNIRLEVATAGDSIGKTENLLDMVKRKKAIAAINANFFNAYSNFEPLGTIVKNGEIVFLGNSGTTVGITEGNKLIFGRPNTIIKGSLDGKFKNEYKEAHMIWNAWNAWNINDIDTNDYSVAIYTPKRGEKVSLKHGLAVVVKDKKVDSIVETPAEISIPKEGFVIYYGIKSSADYKAFVNDRFKVGREVGFIYDIKNKDENKNFNWGDLIYALTAGPRLIVDGSIRVDPKSEGFNEPKIATNKGQRSALGITKDNKMLMVTAGNLTVKELAEVMKALGAYNAVNLDGGASSGLYCKGKMITSPGRKLSTVLLVYGM